VHAIELAVVAIFAEVDVQTRLGRLALIAVLDAERCQQFSQRQIVRAAHIFIEEGLEAATADFIEQGFRFGRRHATACALIEIAP
jgi:hypothetical protein